MPATYGLPRFASLGSVSREYATWRTSQRSLLADTLELFSDNWPRAGMTLDGTAYRLRPLEPIIAATVCGLWPTPSARDHKGTSAASWRLNNPSPDTLPDAMAERLGIPASVSIVPQPMFVEKLMLLPDMWTASAPLGTDGFRAWLQKHSSY